MSDSALCFSRKVSHLNAPVSHLLTVIVCWANASRYYKVKNTAIMLSVLHRHTHFSTVSARWLDFKMMSFPLQWTWRRYLALQRSLLETVSLFNQQSFKGWWWQLHCSSYIGRGSSKSMKSVTNEDVRLSSLRKHHHTFARGFFIWPIKTSVWIRACVMCTELSKKMRMPNSFYHIQPTLICSGPDRWNFLLV